MAGSIRSESRVGCRESRSRSESDEGGRRPRRPKRRLRSDDPAIRSPLVTVAVTHYNLGLYLPAALEAIAAQTYEHLDVIVVDDGSTCPISVRVFNELRQLYPRFRFISQKNLVQAPPATAPLPRRGRVLRPRRCRQRPHSRDDRKFVHGRIRIRISRFSPAFLKAFNHEEGIDADVSEFVYMQRGGSFVLSCFENVYGDTNAIFLTEQFRAAEASRPTRPRLWRTGRRSSG